MCGRYAFAIRPSQVRVNLENQHLHVDDAPPDEGEGAPRQSYNFAPGSRGLVYRAAVPDYGAGPAPGESREQAASAAQDEGSQDNDDDEAAQQDQTNEKTAQKSSTTSTSTNTSNEKTKYILQTMKWGLVPHWTKRDPGYGGMLKTINCRSEGLASPGGMWSSMKGRKRCIVVCQGFYEWLKKGKEKIPHFTKRKDGQLMCFAGLWDCCDYGGKEEKIYSYTIITTESNKQLNFLHDRMPVILEPGSKEMAAWLDPNKYEWSKELQSCLKPYEGELECYPVSQAVGKVGNNDPSFIIPVNSAANKNNIANFFGGGKKATKGETKKDEDETPTKEEPDVKSESEPADAKPEIKSEDEAKDEEEKADVKTENVEHTEDNAPLPISSSKSSPPSAKKGVKREHDDSGELGQSSIEESMEPPAKAAKTEALTGGRKTRSATSNDRGVKRESPRNKSASDGSKKITGFFEKKQEAER